MLLRRSEATEEEGEASERGVGRGRGNGADAGVVERKIATGIRECDGPSGGKRIRAVRRDGGELVAGETGDGAGRGEKPERAVGGGTLRCRQVGEGMPEAERKSRAQKIRWFGVAGVFTALGLGLLKLFVGGFHWHYAISTFVQSEICNLLRFFANDRWVFRKERPTWKRLGQYHAANALGFVVWWAGANALKAAGMNYLVASLVAMLGSVGVSLATNFGWIWKKRGRGAEPARAAAE